MRDTFVAWREGILESLGGLPAPEVKNKEWLSLLKQETRNSIMVEGIFVKEGDLEAVITAGNKEIRNAADVLNYFRTARFLYGPGYENFINKELTLSLGMVRQINKGVLEEESRDPGLFRKGKVIIGGAPVQPPEFDIDLWVRMYIRWVTEHYQRFPLLRFLALQHSLFEAVHPFVDGNGRTGRILTNYFLVSKGVPIVIVKGDETSRESYYKALQEADVRLNDIFAGPPDYETLCAALEANCTEKLEKLFFKGLRESMDTIIITLMEQRGERMMGTEELAPVPGYSRDTIRKLVERGKLISTVRRKRHFSHPSLLYKT
ncbi:MAG: Fic family protein [bacterium]|nr:Fic family protein [bacterium]